MQNTRFEDWDHFLNNRLVGYANRIMNREDFAEDERDAGVAGAKDRVPAMGGSGAWTWASERRLSSAGTARPRLQNMSSRAGAAAKTGGMHHE